MCIVTQSGMFKTTRNKLITRPVKTLNLTANSTFLKDDSVNKTPKYLIISQALRDAIKSGKAKPLEQLPSARQLALQLNTNRHTVMAAFNELIAQGWIVSQQRKGYFVAEDLPVNSSQQVKGAAGIATGTETDINETASFNWQFTKTVDSSAVQVKPDYRYNFAGGLPDIALFPFNEFKSYTSEAFSRPNINELNYGNTAGYLPLIEQITEYLRRARSLINREIVITNGSQEALYILSQILLCSENSVATEAMGYEPAWKAFKSAGADVVSIKQDDKGMIPSALEAAIERQIKNSKPIKLIYLTPLHQYPTTVTLPVSRRHAIYRIASEHNIAIIEDDYDHEYHYKCQPLAPMASDDPNGLVIYLSTFSKVMFPGARIGFMALDKTLSKAIVNYKTIINHKVNVPMQDAIARWMKAGDFERYLRKATKVYNQRRDFMVQQITYYQSLGKVKSFTVPDGGMAMWVEVNQSAEKLAKQALENGIFIQQEGQFLIERDQSQDCFIRLGFAGMDIENIESGLKYIFTLTEHEGNDVNLTNPNLI